jgi:hypothetical protein
MILLKINSVNKVSQLVFVIPVVGDEKQIIFFCVKMTLFKTDIPWNQALFIQIIV